MPGRRATFDLVFKPDANGCNASPRARPSLSKGAVQMIFGEPETSRFLEAVQRLKLQQRKREKQTRQAKQRVREALRKLRDC